MLLARASVPLQDISTGDLARVDHYSEALSDVGIDGWRDDESGELRLAFRQSAKGRFRCDGCMQGGLFNVLVYGCVGLECSGKRPSRRWHAIESHSLN